MNCELPNCKSVAVQKHHITYFPERTIGVCDPCHKQIHKDKDPEYIQFKDGESTVFYSMKKRLHKFGVRL